MTIPPSSDHNNTTTDPPPPPPNFPKYEDDDYDPEAWRRVRPFRNLVPITFVPAGSTPSTFPKQQLGTGRSGADIATEYLRIVGATPVEDGKEKEKICEVCKLPIREGHETSLAHQVALPHSHPPHSLQRSSVGLKILEDSGWDPDSRKGLGAKGEGVRYPVKAVEKKDRIGVGGRVKDVGKVEKKETLNAAEVRKREAESKKKRERIMRELRSGTDWEALMGDKF